MEKIVPVDDGAEAFVELLNANGVDCIFLSPGTDTIYIQEALSKFKAQGKRTPKVILGLHESVGMTAAHGYFIVSGRPQVVLVHVDLGAQQVGGALHNAQRGRIGVVLCAGRSLMSLERKHWVSWMTEQFDQAGVVRGYVKWDYELRSNANIHQVVQRAFQIASTEPCGPVYLILPPELLAEKIDGVLVPDVARYAAPSTPQADPVLLGNAAEMLIAAQNPLIIAGYSGRHPESVAQLIKLAETLGARVVTSLFGLSFPTTHPLWGGTEPDPYLKDADVLLIIDHDVPYAPARAEPQPGARIIQIDIDPVKQNMPTWLFPADILLEADSSKAIPALSEIVRKRLSREQQVRGQDRFHQLESEHTELRNGWRELAAGKAGQKPISADWLCRCIGEEIDESTILLAEVASAFTSVARQISRTEPRTLFNQAGSSLGWGLGAALGAKLAAPDKTVVLLTGDGSFIYGCPTAGLWAASAHNAPYLSIIFNNGQYNAIKRSIQIAYDGNSFSEKTGVWVGTDFAPSPDYTLIAQACGAYGRRVDDPADVKTALREALSKVRGGQPAVLDVRVESV